MKRKIFGENMVRLHGFDPAERAVALAGDEWAARRAAWRADGPSPWPAHRERHGFAVV